MNNFDFGNGNDVETVDDLLDPRRFQIKIGAHQSFGNAAPAQRRDPAG